MARSVDYRERPDLYRIGRGEEGVFGVEPYKSELLPLWRFGTPAEARASATALRKRYDAYRAAWDLVGMDMARNYLQMGWTRSLRYAKYPGGRKRTPAGEAIEPRTWDPAKRESARIFRAALARSRTIRQITRPWKGCEPAAEAKFWPYPAPAGLPTKAYLAIRMPWLPISTRGFRVSDEAHRVTTFELFFDLVFVFAFTQVTQYIVATHSAIGVLQALTILGLLWWSWVAYAWLANQTHVDEGLVRFGMSVAMIAMFVVALVIPEAYVDLDGGLYGPLVLVVGYIVVRVTHIALYYAAAAQDPPLRRQILRTSIGLVCASAFLVAGAFLDGSLQTWLWLAGFGVDLLLTYLTSTGGNWRIHAAGHWAERFGLVIILALGESIVAIGVGAAREPVSTSIIAGAGLAMVLSIALWWFYFDTTSLAAERILADLHGVQRAELAIDGYTYLHFPLIAGIVMAAVGVEQVIAHVSDPDPLGLFGASMLHGGIACYLAGVGFFWFRISRKVKRLRFSVTAFMLAAIPIAASLPPLVALAGIVAVCVGLILFETWRHAEHRRAIRSAHGH